MILLSGFEIYCPIGTYHCRDSVTDGGGSRPQLWRPGSSLANFWAKCKLRAADIFLAVVGREPKTAEMVDRQLMFQLRHACRKVIDRKCGGLLLLLA